jgi:hypothetical protein
MHNNIIITGANSPYFISLLTLINSIHKYSYNIIDAIIVYDFGLDSSEIQRLRSYKKVVVKNISENFDIYESISTVKTKCHFLKMFTLFDSIASAKKVLWLDAGACALDSIQSIFDIIDKEDIFLVGDVHLNKNYTHQKCIDIMKATEDELNDKQLWSGLVGFKTDGVYTPLIKEAWGYSQVEGCIDGYESNHRHDQSVLSILASRYKCKRYDIDRYGYWTDINRNLEKALENNSIIFAHRKGYTNHNDLIIDYVCKKYENY